MHGIIMTFTIQSQKSTSGSYPNGVLAVHFVREASKDSFKQIDKKIIYGWISTGIGHRFALKLMHRSKCHQVTVNQVKSQLEPWIWHAMKIVNSCE